jgi:hypothetical protein
MTITTLDGALLYLLKNNAGVQALVGSRIYVLTLPISCTFPAISIHKISDPFSRFSGAPRFQISSWGKDLLIVKQIAAAIVTALNGYSGILDGIEIVRIIPLETSDIPPDETGLYHIPYDFNVIYKR